MLYKLPLEIIEKIAGDDLYLQALFLKLGIFNQTMFLKTVKNKALEFTYNTLNQNDQFKAYNVMYRKWCIAFTNQVCFIGQ